MDSCLVNFTSDSNYFAKLTLSLPSVQCTEDKNITNAKGDNNSHNGTYILSSGGLSSAKKFELDTSESQMRPERKNHGGGPMSLQEQYPNAIEDDLSSHSEKTSSECSIRCELHTSEKENDNSTENLDTISQCSQEKECLLKVLDDLITAFETFEYYLNNFHQ